MQNNSWLQALIVLLVIIASLFLASLVWSFFIQFSNVILLFFLSWLLAFILRPVARSLTNGGINYTLSVLIVYLGLAIVLTIGGFLLVPVITQQVSDLNKNFGAYVQDINGIVKSGQDVLKTNFGLKDVDITKYTDQLINQIQSIGPGILGNAITLLQSIATLVLQLILVFLLSFYFMKDGDRIFGGLRQLLPPRWQDEARLLAISIEKSFGAFVRGQLLFAAAYAILTAIVMIFFGLDYVVIASIVAGLAMIIPLVGNFIAFAPPMLVCLVTRPGDWWLLLVVLFIMQSLQMNIIGPRIMSQAIGIHPLYVMAAILMGGQVAGFWGALFGIPVAGTINLMGRPLMRRIRYQMPIYQEVKGVQVTTTQFTTGPLRAAVTKKSKLAAGSAEQETIVTEKTEVVETNEAPTDFQLPSSEEELDFDRPEPRAPTLSGKVWHLLWVFVSRAYRWVGSRAHIRTTRH